MCLQIMCSNSLHVIHVKDTDAGHRDDQGHEER